MRNSTCWWIIYKALCEIYRQKFDNLFVKNEKEKSWRRSRGILFSSQLFGILFRHARIMKVHFEIFFYILNFNFSLIFLWFFLRNIFVISFKISKYQWKILSILYSWILFRFYSFFKNLIQNYINNLFS